MKVVSIVLGILLTISFFAKADGLEKVKSVDKLVWFGIDYTQVQCIEDAEGGGFTNPNDIVNRMFRSWNGLFITEGDKYDLQKAFDKKTVKFNNESVDQLNEDVEPGSLIVDEPKDFSESQLASMIKKYESNQYEGVGLVFIAEQLNKAKEIGVYHIVFFDIASRNILVSKKMSGEAGGFGFRNYWAASYYEVLKKCKKTFPKKW